MIKKTFIIIFLLTMLLIDMSFNSIDAKSIAKPKIVDIKTSPSPNINQWVTLPPKKSGSMFINVKVEGAQVEKVNFWLVPAKKKTWEKSWDQRELLSEDTTGSDGWSTTFNYGEKNILTFIVVEVIGESGEKEKDWFYVVYKK